MTSKKNQSNDDGEYIDRKDIPNDAAVLQSGHVIGGDGSTIGRIEHKTTEELIESDDYKNSEEPIQDSVYKNPKELIEGGNN